MGTLYCQTLFAIAVHKLLGVSVYQYDIGTVSFNYLEILSQL